MEEPVKIEDFQGVYLLVSKSENPYYRNRCYIGYTVNPNRRIKQHNKGPSAGGAKRTKGRGPWVMVMIIHGFPTSLIALGFEFAWQNPKTSLRLKMIPLSKRRNESIFQNKLRILSEMLRTGPWNRLPLTIRWLQPDFYTDFPAGKSPPIHMPICHGHVAIKKKPQTDVNPISNGIKKYCALCSEIIDNAPLTCLNPTCNLVTHTSCLAKRWLRNEGTCQYIPTVGKCPECSIEMSWGDLIRKINGCSDLEDININKLEDDDDEYLSLSSDSEDHHSE